MLDLSQLKKLADNPEGNPEQALNKILELVSCAESANKKIKLKAVTLRANDETKNAITFEQAKKMTFGAVGRPVYKSFDDRYEIGEITKCFLDNEWHLNVEVELINNYENAELVKSADFHKFRIAPCYMLPSYKLYYVALTTQPIDDKLPPIELINH